MQKLQLEKQTAVRLYKSVPKWFQETLVSSFGSECFSGKITDRVKTFEDALDEADEETKRRYQETINDDDTPDECAFKKLKLIIKVINEGWSPNWEDTNEKKWYPWFKVSSGFGFSDSDYFCTSAGTNVGSRLCFSSEEKSDYVAQQFIDLYKEFLT
jgi:hypothetical protein